MERMCFRGHSSQISLPTSTVLLCIAVQNLFPVATSRHTNSVVSARNRGEVADSHDEMIRASRLRMKLTMLFSQSSMSSHSNPLLSKSNWCKASSERYSSLRSL